MGLRSIVESLEGGPLSECGLPMVSSSNGAEALRSPDARDPEDVVGHFDRLVRRLRRYVDDAEKAVAGESGSPEPDPSMLGAMVQDVLSLVRSSEWLAQSSRRKPDARLSRIEARLRVAVLGLPKFVLGALSGSEGKAESVVEAVYRLVDKRAATTRRVARHLVVGAGRIFFDKLHDAFVKQNPEATLDDFRLTLLALVDTLEPKGEAKSRKIDRGLRSRITVAFEKAGLDGNGRFEKADRGYAAALEVLSSFGIELDEVKHAMTFQPDSGQTTVRLAWSNPADSFSPEPIDGTMLALSWYKLADRRYEVIAYLS